MKSSVVEKEMRKFENIVLDFGHGGIDKKGHYTTAPSKMHTFPDGDVVYEGVLNRQIGGLLYILLKIYYPHINTICTVYPHDYRDLSLPYRVRVANSLPLENTLFISIHHNSSQKHNAGGFELYTTKGHTFSDIVSESIANSIEPLVKDVKLNLRYDFTDGDKDKEVDFYVLRKTKCSAVLLELGFFDYLPDLKVITDKKFQYEMVYKIMEGIDKFLIK